MDTTTAAAQAGVTIPTIRHWCRYGAVAAIKHAGRWVVDAASLARRIAIGKEHRRMPDTTPPLPWDSDHPDHELLTAALNAGVPLEKISDLAGPRSLTYGHALRNREKDRLQDLIFRHGERRRLLDEIERLSICFGHDGKAKRAAADRKLDDPGLRKFIRDCYAYARTKGIDVRTEEQKNPQQLPATDRQIDYILDLQAQRRRSGDAGGFMNGIPTTREGLAKLTRAEASRAIDSLRENY